MQYAKVAEYQRRGLIHFHALIRLDGPDADGFAAAPARSRRRRAGRSRPTPPCRPSRLRPRRRRRRLGAGAWPSGASSTCGWSATAAAPTTRPDRCPRAGRRLPGQVRHQGRRPTPGRPAPPRTAHPRHHPRPRPSSPPRQRCTGTTAPTITGCSASGHTCSASAATSPPSPGATRSPSARCAGPAAGPSILIAEARASRPTARPGRASRPTSSPTTTTRPPWSSAAGPTPAPAGPTTANSPRPRRRRPRPRVRPDEQPSRRKTHQLRREEGIDGGMADRGPALVGPGRDASTSACRCTRSTRGAARGPVRLAAGWASGSATGRRTSATGSRRCRRRSRHEAAGTGRARRLTIVREGRGFVAYLRYRDYAGRGRRVKRSGRSRAEASRKVLKAVREALGRRRRRRVHRQDHPRGGRQGLAGDVRGPGRARSAIAVDLDEYRYVVSRVIVPGMGSLRLGEVTTPRLDRFVQAVLVDRGYATAKLTRSVLSGDLRLAGPPGALCRATRSATSRRSSSTGTGPLGRCRWRRCEPGFALLDADLSHGGTTCRSWPGSCWRPASAWARRSGSRGPMST